MKRIILILVGVFALLGSSCDSVEQSPEQSPTNGDVSFPMGPIMINPEWISWCYCLNSSGGRVWCDLIPDYYGPQWKTWREENRIDDLEAYAQTQWEAYIGRALKPGEASEFFYGRLSDVVITADCEVNGKPVGENLTEFFDVFFSSYCYFEYPSGELAAYNTGEIPETMSLTSFEEFIKGNYFLPRRMCFCPNIDDKEVLMSATFTIKLTINNELGDMVTSGGFKIKWD